MDLETIRRINRDALRAAKEAAGETEGETEGAAGTGLSTQTTMYIVAIIVAIATYFLLKNVQPEFVMSTSGDNGIKKFDETRAIIASIVAGLIVILIYNMMQ